MPVSDAVLTQILAQLEAMQIQQQTMQAKVMVSVNLCDRLPDPILPS